MGPLEKKKKKKNRIGNILEDDADLEVEEGEYYEDGKTGTVWFLGLRGVCFLFRI